MAHPNFEKEAIGFVPVTAYNAHAYVSIGIQSYKEHYLHLWENSDPSPFINEFLTIESVLAEIEKPTSFFYIVERQSQPTGILNFTLDKPNPYFPNTETLLLNKLYLIRAEANRGIGTVSLKFTEQFAQNHNKQVVWLYAMKKGEPKSFYLRNGYQITSEAEITLPKVLDSEKAMWVMAKVL